MTVIYVFIIIARRICLVFRLVFELTSAQFNCRFMRNDNATAFDFLLFDMIRLCCNASVGLCIDRKQFAK